MLSAGALQRLWGPLRLANLFPTRYLGVVGSAREASTWKSPLRFSGGQPRISVASSEITGLFQIPLLKSPAGFDKLTKQCLSDAKALVEQAQRVEGGVELVKALDRLSNTICVVCDMAAFIQYSHADAAFRKAAYGCTMALVELIERLNLDMDLVKPLWRLIQDKEAFSAMPPAAQRTAQLLWNDFEISGNTANLSPEDRGHCQDLHQEIKQYASEVLMASNVSAWERIDWHNLPQVLRAHPALVQARDGRELHKAIFTNADQAVRQGAFEAIFQPDREAAKLMFSLVQRRHDLAKLTGHRSFADRALRFTTAGNVERVQEFLGLLSEKLKPRAQTELSVLHAFQQNYAKGLGGQKGHSNGLSSAKCGPVQLDSNDNFSADSYEQSKMLYYDLRYWLRLMKGELFIAHADGFPLHSALNGLNKLLKTTFGISLVSQPTMPGELWADDVVKMAVMPIGQEEDEDQTVGVLYCDLFQRADKLSGECHDTIRCGWARDGHVQRPISVLRCSLRRGTPLSFDCLRSLFHEFGHGVHSMLNQPQYQHIAGTRCPTDFAEVPSELMEIFASDHRIISLLLDGAAESNKARLIDAIVSDKLFRTIDMQEQVAMAAFDLEVHLSPPTDVNSLIALHAEISNKHNSFIMPNGYDQLHLSHAESYGSTYYSYMWSLATASLLWQHLFAEDPLSRHAGKHYTEAILSNGNHRPPTEMIAEALGYTPSVEDLVNALIGEIDRSVYTLKKRWHQQTVREHL